MKDNPGIVVGKVVSTGQKFVQSWEDLSLDIWGPRRGKSTSRMMPKWCIEWYFHPEAVSRVAAMWRSWEHLRPGPATGMSVWWKDHTDHHMRVLLDPQGPFFNYDMKEHREPDHLEPKKAPEGWFRDARTESP